MQGMFHLFAEKEREKLRRAGYHEAVGFVRGVPYWRTPDGAIVTEEEAFKALSRQEQEQEPVANEKKDSSGARE